MIKIYHSIYVWHSNFHVPTDPVVAAVFSMISNSQFFINPAGFAPYSILLHELSSETCTCAMQTGTPPTTEVNTGSISYMTQYDLNKLEMTRNPAYGTVAITVSMDEPEYI